MEPSADGADDDDADGADDGANTLLPTAFPGQHGLDLGLELSRASSAAAALPLSLQLTPPTPLRRRGDSLAAAAAAPPSMVAAVPATDAGAAALPRPPPGQVPDNLDEDWAVVEDSGRTSAAGTVPGGGATTRLATACDGTAHASDNGRGVAPVARYSAAAGAAAGASGAARASAVGMLALPASSVDGSEDDILHGSVVTSPSTRPPPDAGAATGAPADAVTLVEPVATHDSAKPACGGAASAAAVMMAE
eukprot:125558-Chlamydomonas_euryale.AAC.1